MSIALPLSLIVFPVVGLLVYWCCLNGPPIFDDNEAVNYTSGYKWTWEWMRYRQRPLTALSFALQREWPNTMRGIHVFNVMAHVGCAWVVERIAVVLGMDAGLAILAALLYLVHPFAVNSVGYMTGRASVLSCFFGLLSAWAILAGYPVLVFPALLAAMASKEDGAGYLAQSLCLLCYRGYAAFGAVAFAFGLWVAWKHRTQITDLYRNTGDLMMGRIGLPTSLPQPLHAATILVETLWRIPLWMIGIGQSCWHGSGIRITGKSLGMLVIWIPVVYFGILAPVPILLIVVGPWLVYPFCPIPDQIVEYRNYSMIAGFSIALTSQLESAPMWIWVPLLTGFALLTASRAVAYSSVIQFWTEAAAHTSGDASRAYQELGAWTKAAANNDTDLANSEKYLREAVRINPRLGPALNNLGWVLIQRAWSRTPLNEQRTIDPEGRAILAQCVDVCPEYAHGLQDYGVILEFEGKPEQARLFYLRALDLEPKMEVSLNRLGLMEFKAGRRDFARSWFEKVFALNPTHWEYVYNQAVIWKHTGNVEEGQALLKSIPQPFPVTDNMIPMEFAK